MVFKDALPKFRIPLISWPEHSASSEVAHRDYLIMRLTGHIMFFILRAQYGPVLF